MSCVEEETGGARAQARVGAASVAHGEVVYVVHTPSKSLAAVLPPEGRPPDTLSAQMRRLLSHVTLFARCTFSFFCVKCSGNIIYYI